MSQFCNLQSPTTGGSMQKLLASPEHCLHLVNTSQSSRKFNNLPASSDKGSMQRIIQSGLITEVTGVCVCCITAFSSFGDRSSQLRSIFPNISTPVHFLSAHHLFFWTSTFHIRATFLLQRHLNPIHKISDTTRLCYFLLTPAPDACLRALALRSPQLTLPHSSAPSSS